MHRFELARIAEAELELLNQIAALKQQYERRRNFNLCRIPAELLTRSLSFLPAKDILSIIRVCQLLRAHVIGTPGLWTNVNDIRNPAAFSFVLECTRNLPVDITRLCVTGPDDALFDILAAHMHHIRTLCLDFSLIASRLEISSYVRAHKAFTVTAPLLQRLAMRAQKEPNSGELFPVYYHFLIEASKMPQLSSLQLHGVQLNDNAYGQLQSLRSFSYSGPENTPYMGTAVAELVSQRLRNLTTINLELDGWYVYAGSRELGPAVQRINIHWTRHGLFFPRAAVPPRVAWQSVRAIHVAHVHNSSDAPQGATLVPTMFAIPETTAPYQTLSVRTSVAPDTRVHVRAIDSEGRERTFCGIHQSTVVGMVAHIPRHELSAITITATAVALRALSDARCPLLSCIRLVLDTDDIAWINGFARDMPNITTLERLEFSQEAGGAAPKWTTTVIMRTISSCIAAGNTLQEVVFLGFSPEPQCTALVGMFSQQVTINQDWREPKTERVWFTDLPFEWY